MICVTFVVPVFLSILKRDKFMDRGRDDEKPTDGPPLEAALGPTQRRRGGSSGPLAPAPRPEICWGTRDRTDPINRA